MRCLLSLILLLLTIACTKYHVCTNTFVDSKAIPCGFPQGSSFDLISLNEENPLFSKEIGFKIEKLLEGQGYSVLYKDRADYHLEYDFHIEKSYGKTYVPSFVPGRTYISCGRFFNSRGRSSHFIGQTQIGGSTVYVPYRYSYYTREIALTVYNHSNDPVWQGCAVSSGKNSDLRAVADYLLVSLFDYFGENTHQYVSTEISAKNPTVLRLREDS